MKIKLLSMALSLIYMPISMFLSYKMLELIQASELMWFIYWMLVPFAFVVGIVTKLAEWEED